MRPDSRGRAATSNVVAAVTAKRAGRTGALWGVAFGATAGITMLQYRSLFPTAASRKVLVLSLQGSTALQTLFGPIHRVDTVAGYTAYKTTYTLVILAAVWGLMAATRALRGEEDAGRWDLLLAGLTSPGRSATEAAVGLGAGAFAAWASTALLVAGAGAQPKVGISVAASVFLATAVGATALLFMALGMVMSQLFGTQHAANVAGAGVLVASYLIRMVADSASSLAWLRWASPFGWVEEMRPLTGSKPLAFVPLFGAAALLIAVAVGLASRRDAGASVFHTHDRAPAHTRWLRGPGTLTARLVRGSVLGWLTAFGVVGLVLGLVTQAAGHAAKGAPALERAVARLGGRSTGTATYLGLAFVIVAGLGLVAAAGQLAAVWREEGSGRLDNLVVRPVARWRWLGGRITIGALFVVVAGMVAATAAWIGATSQHTDVGVAAMAKAGVNVVPPGLLVLGLGVLAYGVWPRRAVAITYAVVVWSFIVETIASASGSSHWLRDTSPLLHIRPAPATDPNWTAAFWLVALAAAAGVTGIAAFSQRDLQGG